MTYLPYRPDRAPATSPVATPRLTAAAPDLLAALQGLLDVPAAAQPRPGLHDDMLVWSSRVRAAREAIAKATGESQ